MLLRFLFSLLFLLPCLAEAKKSYSYDLALCAIFRDEAPYLKEWIEFHKCVGVQHFYLYNNLSKDNFRDILAPYIKSGEVELFDWKYTYTSVQEWSPIQRDAYNDAIKKSTGKSKWLAILDLDEFLFPTECDSLVEFLAGFEEFGAVSANWLMFGTSQVVKIPQDKLLIEMLVNRAPIEYEQNIHVKSVVRPERVATCVGPHFCKLKKDFKQVNALKDPFEGARAPYIDVSKLRIHHYWTRDEDFFYRVKLARRQGWQEGREGGMKRLAELNRERDETIVRYVPALKKAMFH